MVFLYPHIRTNETNGEKLSNEEAHTLKGMFNEAFAINFSQKNKILGFNTNESDKICSLQV